MKKIFIIPLILILISIIVTADPESYTTIGADRFSTYQKDGTGVWSAISPVTYQREYDNVQVSMALVGNVDGDTENEIIIIADNYLTILNYTTGIGILTEQALLHGNMSIGTRRFEITPELYDWDNNGIYEIIASNITHMMIYSWNGTQIILNQSVPTNIYTAIPQNTNPRKTGIKCAPHFSFSNSKDTCVMSFSNHTSSTYNILLQYNIDDNYINTSIAAAANSNPSSDLFMPPHLYDADNDGYLEAFFIQHDPSQYLIRIYKVDVPTTTAPTLLYTHDLGGGSLFTDIIVNKLDGATPSISWGFTDDAENYDIRTINANTGAVIKLGYCSTLLDFSCPEGDSVSVNIIEPISTIYTDYPGDVCIYIRSATQNDPGINKDTIYCASKYNGDGYKETVIDNNINSSVYSILIHDTKIAGDEGLLLSKFLISLSDKETALLNNGFNIPVDYQQSGSLDIIGINSSRIWYYDDNYINYNYEIVKYQPNTGNPYCLGYIYSFTLTIKDAELDSGDCYLDAVYSNTTHKSYYNISTAPFTSNKTFNFFADELGSFTLNFYCKDQYHTVYDSITDVILVKNESIPGTLCNTPGINPPSPTDYTTVNETSESNMLIDQFNDFSSNFGINSQLAKSIISLILIVLLGAGTAISLLSKQMQGNVVVFIISLETVAGLIIFYWIGWMSAIPLVIIGLVCAMVIVGYFFGKSNQIGG
jgi:hypothetical protein